MTPFSPEDDELIVFAADQEPFGDQPNRFCTLYPLMTLAGDRLSADDENFPRRGRVWWKVRSEFDSYAVPGSVWVGAVELAPNYSPSDWQKDKYQVRMKDIRQGDDDLIEIIDLEVDNPSADVIYRNERIPYQRQPVKLVFLRGAKTVLGPLKASWSSADRSLSFAVQNPTRPELLRIPTEVFGQKVRCERFSFLANQVHVSARQFPLAITLSKSSWINFPTLRESGEVLVAVVDSVVINWAAKQAGLTNAQSKEVKAFIAKVLEQPANLTHQYFERFQEITKNASIVADLGESVAMAISETPAYRDLVCRHIETVTSDKIKQEIARREAEIVAEMGTVLKQKQVLQNEIAKLQDEFQVRMRENEEELRKHHEEQIRSLEIQENLLAEREKSVAEKEDVIASRLERLTLQYGTESERVADEFFAQLPFFSRLLGTPGSEKEKVLRSEPASKKLALPKYLHVKKEDYSITEEQFLGQFRQVVAQRGYLFSDDDLLNFHVTMKVGGLAILAGPSGTGKSSLPRFYAEALGCSEEYLHIPVRPDWLDDRDLVGAFNSLTRRFEPANSGLVDHLIAAQEDRRQNRGGIFLICLDEMNLARVEHYFAQFLSVSEKVPAERLISLFAEGLTNDVDPYAPYRLLPLNENLRFVGTVNIDETTHFFSPKILDRSQVLSFQSPDLDALGATVLEDEKLGGILPVTAQNFDSWTRFDVDLTQPRTFLLQIDSILKGARLGLTYRPFRRMLQYVAASRGLMRDDQALDIQLLQVVFPKLRSTAPNFENTLEALLQTVTGKRFPRSAELLQKIKDSGDDYEYFQLI